MLVHRRQRREVEAASDFLQTRRVAVVLDELVQVVEDFTLPFGEREHFIPPVEVDERTTSADYNANRRRKSIGMVNRVNSPVYRQRWRAATPMNGPARRQGALMVAVEHF